LIGALKQVAGRVPVVVKAGPNEGVRWSLTTSGRGYGDGSFERGKMDLLCGMIAPGECFWDIGAHKGYVSLLASRLVGQRGRVYAFEPAADNLGFLRRHLKWNRADNVTVFPFAIADQDGQEWFGGGSSLSLKLGGGGEVVEVRSIESLLEREGLRAPTFLKIDVEGAEARVLQGAGESLYAPDRAILVATHSKQSFEECSSILKQGGFRTVESGEVEDLRRRSWTGRGDPDLLALGSERSVSEDILEAFKGQLDGQFTIHNS
jgi:FkbM family methyltransferase